MMKLTKPQQALYEEMCIEGSYLVEDNEDPTPVFHLWRGKNFRRVHSTVAQGLRSSGALRAMRSAGYYSTWVKA